MISIGCAIWRGWSVLGCANALMVALLCLFWAFALVVGNFLEVEEMTCAMEELSLWRRPVVSVCLGAG